MIAITTDTIVEQRVSKRRLFDTILVKVSARCNLACSYCYFFFSEDQRWRQQPPHLAAPLWDALAQNLSDLSEHQDGGFAVVLHGGEPLLLGEQKLKNGLKCLRRALPNERVPISIQTNGALITNELLEICSEFRTTLSVSIDGPEEVHDQFRLTHRGESSFEKTRRGISLLRSHHDANFLFSGTLTVINPDYRPEYVYSLLKKLG